jgi:acetolactate synthase-1/2/3 large subunit
LETALVRPYGQMKNVELVVRMLEEAGVRWVFGIPSGPVLPLIEALRRSKVDFVLTASETSAGFMATTVGQLSGVPGVCVATLGPGATNLSTGVGAAWLDRAPLLAITCNVPTEWLERRIQMRIDHHALFRPLTKASFGLRADNVASTLAMAMSLACAEPPGPVHLDLPEDVGVAGVRDVQSVGTGAPRPAYQAGRPGTTSEMPGLGQGAETAPLRRIPVDEVARRVSEALRRSRRPLLVTGSSFTRCENAPSLLHFIERQGLPFISTLHAKGFLPESHPNWAGVLGRARRTDVQAFVQRADLILAIGYDPIEINYEEWSGTTPVIHVSTEQAEVSHVVNLELNAATDLERAIDRLAELENVANEWSRAEIEDHRRGLDAALRPACEGLGPHQVLDLLRERLPADGILAYDVGAHTHQIATQWRTDLPWTCLATNGWSSMGYGMPAAYAAKLVHPERTVVSVIGDGCFQMTVGELATARRLNLAVPTVVLNDGWLGLMKVKLERKEYELYGVQLGDPVPSPPHYFGVPCRAAHNFEELEAALAWGLNLDGPSVIEAFVDVEPNSQTVYD